MYVISIACTEMLEKSNRGKLKLSLTAYAAKKEKKTTSTSKAKIYQLGTNLWEYFFIILFVHKSFDVKNFIAASFSCYYKTNVFLLICNPLVFCFACYLLMPSICYANFTNFVPVNKYFGDFILCLKLLI